jgi:hypothetical protein|tara:strand:- start:2089 stop:2277 length:189 start_codon:yes stop_codon:yes gene_type:complete
MAKYKIKKSYLELKDTENYCSLGSPAKHGRLIAGETLELSDVPEKVKSHLQEVGKKITKKEK